MSDDEMDEIEVEEHIPVADASIIQFLINTNHEYLPEVKFVNEIYGNIEVDIFLDYYFDRDSDRWDRWVSNTNTTLNLVNFLFRTHMQLKPIKDIPSFLSKTIQLMSEACYFMLVETINDDRIFNLYKYVSSQDYFWLYLEKREFDKFLLIIDNCDPDFYSLIDKRKHRNKDCNHSFGDNEQLIVEKLENNENVTSELMRLLDEKSSDLSHMIGTGMLNAYLSLIDFNKFRYTLIAAASYDNLEVLTYVYMFYPQLKDYLDYHIMNNAVKDTINNFLPTLNKVTVMEIVHKYLNFINSN